MDSINNSKKLLNQQDNNQNQEMEDAAQPLPVTKQTTYASHDKQFTYFPKQQVLPNKESVTRKNSYFKQDTQDNVESISKKIHVNTNTGIITANTLVNNQHSEPTESVTSAIAEITKAIAVDNSKINRRIADGEKALTLFKQYKIILDEQTFVKLIVEFLENCCTLTDLYGNSKNFDAAIAALINYKTELKNSDDFDERLQSLLKLFIEGKVTPNRYGGTMLYLNGVQNLLSSFKSELNSKDFHDYVKLLLTNCCDYVRDKQRPLLKAALTSLTMFKYDLEQDKTFQDYIKMVIEADCKTRIKDKYGNSAAEKLLEKYKDSLTEPDLKVCVRKLIASRIKTNNQKSAVNLLKTYKSLLTLSNDDYELYIKDLTIGCTTSELNDIAEFLKTYQSSLTLCAQKSWAKRLFIDCINANNHEVAAKLLETYQNLLTPPVFVACVKDLIASCMKNERNLELAERVLGTYQHGLTTPVYSTYIKEIVACCMKHPLIYTSFAIELFFRYRGYLTDSCLEDILIANRSDPSMLIDYLKPYITTVDQETLKYILETIDITLGSDLLFNHIKNRSSDSILKLIDNAKVSGKITKQQMMEVVINYLQQKEDISPILIPLEDILYKENYRQSKIIFNFIKERLLPQKQTKAQTEACHWTDWEITLVLDENPVAKPRFLLNNNSLINQMIYFSRTVNLQHNSQLSERLGKLEKRYNALVGLLENNVLTQLQDICGDMNEYLVFRTNNEYNNEILAVNHKYYRRWALNDNKAIIGVDNAHWFDENGEYKPIIHPESLFTTFEIFRQAYNETIPVMIFSKLLKILKLNKYEQMFIDALEVSKLDKNNAKFNLTNVDHQQKLKNIFNPHFVNDDTTIIDLQSKLTRKHVGKIMKVYNKTVTSSTEQAQLLICLSAMFVKYSSSSFFGTETASPEALRTYALALLNEALELKPTVVNQQYLEENNYNWRYKLAGHNGAFSCSSTLSTEMLDEASKKYPKVLNAVLPIAWL